MKQPKQFINLHCHSDASVGDAIGKADEYIDYAIENGMNSIALTDHGNMNAFSSQYLHVNKLKKKGIDFKPIFGIENYYIPSIIDWQKLKNKLEEEKENDIENRAVVEDINESKSWTNKNPLTQRNHLVLLAKNSMGLKSLFRLVSNSYIDGYYRYPRIDLKMLRDEAKGNIIVTSACIYGPLARIICDNQTEQDWTKWKPSKDNFDLIQGLLKKSIEELKDAVGDENFYLELQCNKLIVQHLVNYHLIEASKNTNTPLVVATDAHYPKAELWREREIHRLMAWSVKGNKDNVGLKDLPKSIDELDCELYPKIAEQVWSSYEKTCKAQHDFYDDNIMCEAIERTWSIAHEQIEKDVEPDRKVKLPSIHKLVAGRRKISLLEKLDETNSNEDDLAFEELKALAKDGIKKRGKDKEPEYINRLVYELKVIRDLKFAKYFLTYAKIMDILGKHMLLGLGRGSAAASLLSYCLNITQADPIKFDLLFTRFLTPKKLSYPDIDSDVSNRDKAIKLLGDYFGKENVIAVSNFNQLQLRSLIKDIARLHEIPFEEINSYTSKIEQEALQEAKKTPGFDRAQWVLTYEEAETNSQTFRALLSNHPDFERMIKVLFKQIKSCSRHAGGVVILENSREAMPIIKSGGVLQTPWPEGLNARHLEDFGLLKFDILGLGTLRMFEECVRKIIQKETGAKYVAFKDIQKWFYKNIHPDNNALDDIKVYKHVYWEKRFAGVFQFISQNVQNFISQMEPRNIDDIAVATSLYRPGPLALGADKVYLENRKNPKNIKYKHPLLKEVLGDTYGCLVFQEQLQLIYHKLAGVPLEETDSVRKAFTKKDLSNREKAEKERKVLRDTFITKCREVNNISEVISGDIFDDLEKNVAYLFNKSHATSYAITSYICAYFLTYYPDEWITTYIDYCSTEKGKGAGKDDPRSVALAEAKALGYEICKPDINVSTDEYQIIDGNKLIPSFTSLKNVGKSVLKEIEQYRPYKTLENLLFSSTYHGDAWRHSKFNKRALSTLVKLEAFGSMDLVGKDYTFDNYQQLHYVLVDKADELKKAVAKRKYKTHKEALTKIIEEAKQLPEWTNEEKIKFNSEYAGFVNTDLIVKPEILTYLKSEGIKSIDEWENEDKHVWAIVKNSFVAKTKKGRSYLRIKLYGEAGSVQQAFCWNFDDKRGDRIIPENTFIISRFKRNDFGLSTFFGSIDIVKSN